MSPAKLNSEGEARIGVSNASPLNSANSLVFLGKS